MIQFIFYGVLLIVYYLPNDESTYLLFDNNDNLKIYTKTWLPFGLEKKLSYMRYIIFEFNNNRICIDLETMKFINLVSNGYSTHSLRYIGKPNVLNLEIQNKQFTNSLYDYYGKKYKISKHNKQMEIIFNLVNKKIILQLNSDSKYQDIRNNINIIFSSITEKEIENYNGALISEKKAFRINETKLFKISNKFN